MKTEICTRWDTFYDVDTGEWTERPCLCDPEDCDYAGRPEKHPSFCAECQSMKVYENHTP